MLASLTSSVTSFIGDYGLYAVFVLMFFAAVVPTASELVMLYAGALASGAFASAHVTAFGSRISTAAWAYLAVVLTGVVANTLGALGGWLIGSAGGRPFLEHHGRWLHVDADKLARAESRYRDRGAPAVALGFALPVVRSFVAIPAGIVRIPLSRFLPSALLGTAVFCFALAGLGWAVGSSYDRVHGDLRYVDIAAVVLVLAGVVLFVRRRRRSSAAAARPERS